MLKGKTALVTGSTSGIGQGIARALAKQGANLVINGFGETAQIEKDIAELRESCGVEVIYNGADLTRADEIEGLIEAARDGLGGIDVLVNNAGVQHVAPIDEFPPEKWDLIISLNNLASAHALVASPFKSAYVAAKHGIAGLTKVVALELAEHNITCNAICPGYVWTPLVEGQVADTAKARGISEEEVKTDVLLAAQPTREFVSIEQLGEFAVFLCSDGAANMTGGIYPVDGGWSAQ